MKTYLNFIPYQLHSLKQAFSALGDTIAKHPDLVNNSQFIFVPGPSDPGLNSLYPR